MSNRAMQGRPSAGRRFTPRGSCTSTAGMDAAAQLRVSVWSRVCGTQGLAYRGCTER